jgi:ABC-2 type transport system permease protein
MREQFNGVSKPSAFPETSTSERTTVNQPLLFARLRWRLLTNTVTVLREQSSFRVVSIFLASFLIWVFVLTLSAAWFEYISTQFRVPAFGVIIAILFDFLFASLAMLLVFSTGLVLYSSLFRTPEATYLLGTPARPDQIFAFKFQGALGFSSWGFLLLGTPVLLGYGVIYKVSVFFYLLLPFFFLGFILLPGCLGALLCLLVVNFFPRQRKQFLVGVGVVLVLLGSFWIYSTVVEVKKEADGREVINKLLGKLDFSQGPIPSHWMSRGLQTAAEGHLITTNRGDAGSLYYLGLLWSNGLVFYLITAALAGRLYRRGYNRLATGGDLRRRYGGHRLDAWLGRLLPFVDGQTRLLIVKDFRTFRRDPAQWAQIAIFFGLMLLYLANIRRLFLADVDWSYKNGLSLLNLTTTGLLMCIYTGRFVYPMLSLEGNKFWILGLLPLQRERLLWGKFLFSLLGVLLFAVSLVVLSDFMLDLPVLGILVHVVAVVALGIGLSGLSVGLGAVMPTFKETDPSKIAAGFGGTLNLVVGLFYLVTLVIVMALPWHAVAGVGDGSGGITLNQVLACLTVVPGIAIALAGAWLTLRAGSRALRRMEF